MNGASVAIYFSLREIAQQQCVEETVMGKLNVSGFVARIQQLFLATGGMIHHGGTEDTERKDVR
jgi:hypothetical protein